MPGGRYPVRGCVRATDDGRGTFLLGAAEGTGAVHGVQGGDGDWIDGSAHKDTTWESGRGEMELDNLSHGGITEDVFHGLPVQGRFLELPG